MSNDRPPRSFRRTLGTLEGVAGLDLRVVRVEGDGRRRGERAGAELADLIHRSLGFYRRYLHAHGSAPEELPRRLGPHREAASAGFPDLIAEIEGMAKGSGASFWELFAVNAFEELEPELEEAVRVPERCTAFVAPGERGPILGHNEQWFAGDIGNVAVIVARPEEGEPFVSPTIVTCLPAVGANRAGVGQAIMSLAADDDRVGVPRVLVSRTSLQATSTTDGVRRAAPPGRAGGYAHLLAARDGEASVVETSATRHAEVSGPVHTNHYLDAGLSTSAPEPSSSSAHRFERATALFAAEAPTTVGRAAEILGDHDGGPDAICPHPEPGDGEEASAIVFSMVCDLGRERMWVAPGRPCDTPFEEIDLAGVFG
jgi:isopenicillin-N N-acyltransferase like protein